jgi:hypothetical protein
MMTDFLTTVFEDQVTVDNPFLYKTKADVLATIKSLGGRALIKNTCSCAHTGFFQSKTQWHCGTCSQCIDRRIAVVATELENDDPEYDYVEDVFCGKREAGYEKNIAVDYIRHAFELSRMSEQEMATKFNLEISRAVRALRGNKRESAQKLIEMHKHHGETVWNVVTQKLTANLPSLLAGDLPQNSMLMTVAGLQHLTNSWIRYGQQVSALLERGVPVACNSHKPENEPHLQEICDGILKANESKLVREFPFARWSSSMTKPDWSLDGVSLWIEAKYVRQKRDIRQITEDIAADITKYGDNQKHVLYVIYDPSHLIVDEEEFSQPISKRQDMMVRFIR